jgi:RimJ/RimL family protein N-acetyltransferase
MPRGRQVVTQLATERLCLRAWRAADLPAHAALSADPRVMEFMPKRLSWAESEARAERIRDYHVEPGCRFWVVEAPGVASFVGLIGLSIPPFEAAFTPCVEIGWHLAAEYWGRGYATEAARRVLTYGFDRCDLTEIVAFTTVANRRSRALMERLGMRRDPEGDFEYPNLPEGHPLRPHVLYSLSRPA